MTALARIQCKKVEKTHSEGFVKQTAQARKLSQHRLHYLVDVLSREMSAKHSDVVVTGFVGEVYLCELHAYAISIHYSNSFSFELFLYLRDIVRSHLRSVLEAPPL